MKYYLNLFLTKENMNYEVEESTGLSNNEESNNERILERESRIVDDIRLNIVLFNLNYPKGIEDAINTPNDVMESHYDTSLILEMFDSEENKLYTFYDLLYSSNDNLDIAKTEYNKLKTLINSSNDMKTLLKNLENSLK